MGTAGGVSRISTLPKGESAMANTTHTQGKAGPGAQHAQDAGKGMMDKARDMAGNVADKAKDLASTAGDRAENLTHRAGSGMESLGHAVRENMPHGGTMGAVADRTARGLEDAGRYLQEEGLSGMADDFTDMIR